MAQEARISFFQTGNVMFQIRTDFNLSDYLDSVPIENRMVGLVYFVFSLFCIVPYTVCLWCILADANMRKKPTYIIVLHIGIADVLQLIFNGLFGGVFTFFGNTWGFRTNKLIGGIMNIGWVVYTALAHVLSFNRFVVICKPHLKERCFSKHKTNLMMLSCWIYGFVWFVVYMCPNLSVVFNIVQRNWDYDQRKFESVILWYIELVQDSFHFFMSIVWYAFAFKAVRKTASQISDHQINENRKEMKLLIQAMLICAMIGLTLIGFFAVPMIFTHDAWSTTASNFIWLACCGTNCAIYLKFNKTIRYRVWGKFKCGASVSMSSASVAPQGALTISRTPQQTKRVRFGHGNESTRVRHPGAIPSMTINNENTTQINSSLNLTEKRQSSVALIKRRMSEMIARFQNPIRNT